MSSRDKILSAIKNNQPSLRELPELPAGIPSAGEELVPKLIAVLEAIGGKVYTVSHVERIRQILHEEHPDAQRIISGCPGVSGLGEGVGEDPHTLENVDLAILPASFCVAENGACWITEEQMIMRVLPFICQHLALVIDKKEVVANMHEAYARIGDSSYGFGTFIAGPSKTADIEQSLVLGAHGPRTMTLFLLDEALSDEGFY